MMTREEVEKHLCKLELQLVRAYSRRQGQNAILTRARETLEKTDELIKMLESSVKHWRERFGAKEENDGSR